MDVARLGRLDRHCEREAEDLGSWRAGRTPGGELTECNTPVDQQSSTSRYDRPKRRYQQNATTMTLGGSRKPAKATCAIGAG
jgi:hypothetical protein